MTAIASRYPVEFAFPPSEQQHAIFEHLLSSKASLVVQAGPGSGKTTTLVAGAQLLIASGTPARDLLFVAFNKAIVAELAERLPAGVRAATMHSFGMQILRDHLPSLEVKNFKYSDLIKNLLAEEGVRPYKHPKYKEVSDACKDLLNTVRLNLMDFSVHEELLNALEDSQPDYPKAHGGVIVSAVQQALIQGQRSAERRGEIDFTDMLYLPWKLDLSPKDKYPIVMADELQDQSDLQRWLTLRAMKPGGQLVGVGDKNQSIYLFAGARADSMDRVQKAVRAEVLPLSVTRRCPVSHVLLAQALAGDDSVQPAPGAAHGEARIVSHDEFTRQVKEGDAVLCRTNRPLISQAFEFIRAGRRAKIRGRDIGQGLIKTVDAVANTLAGFTLPAFLSEMELYGSEKVMALHNRTDLNEEQVAQRVQEVQDRVEVIQLIAEESKATSVEDVRACIERLFDDSLGDFILLSTIHKSKGLEFSDVYLLEPEKLPAIFAQKSADDIQAERCVTFVALTRAKRGLFFVGGLPQYPGLKEALAKINKEAA